MKIAHITTSLVNGGSEAAMFRLICSSGEHRHVVISLTGSGVYESLLQERGVTVYCLQFKGVGLTIKPFLELRRILKFENPNVIQAWMYHANLIGGVIARLLGKKAIFWNLRTSNPQLDSSGRMTQWVNRISALFARYIPARIISCAHRVTDVHIKMGYPENMITTICNGYDLSVLNFRENERLLLRAQWEVAEGTFLLGIVARWHPQKNHRLFLDAMSQARSSVNHLWKLVFVGPDMDYDNADLVALLHEFDMFNDVILVGPHENIPAVMSALDLHVLTSTDEGFPNVIAEAMACLSPCISTDVGDSAYIIGDTGWINPARDAKALSENIQEAFLSYSDIASWKVKCASARKRILEMFSIEVMTKQYLEVWSYENYKKKI